MGLIDIFKKKEERKEQSKCARCFRPIAGSVYTIDNNNYCRECYNRKMAVIQQTGGQPVAVTQKIPPQKSAQNKLPVAERGARCFDNIPAEQRNSGKLSDHITWRIEKSILYIQGYGTLTRGDYLTITAPDPRLETMTYTNVLPWAVSNTIRQSKYIGEGYNVAEIPTHIEGVVVDSEIEGLKEFLLNANDYVGVQLQSPDEYLCRISVVPGCKQNLNLLVQQLLADIEKIRPSRLSYYEDMFEKTLNGRLNYECTLEYNSTEGTYDLVYWERGHIVGGIKEKSVEDFRFSFFQNEFFTIRIRYIKKDLENMLLALWPLFENKEIIKQRIKAYQAKYELGEFDFETMTFMECADDQHHFVDLKHFNKGSDCKCQKCDLVIQFNRGAPDRIEPKEWKAFIEKYKGSKIDFYYPPYSN